jgi:hypothetical protein
MKKWLFSLAFLAVFTHAQEQPTPYELIRPNWPATWDEASYNKVKAGVAKGSVPALATPFGYAPNTVIPDTTAQPYLDAMNIQISPIRVNQAGYRDKDLNKYIYFVGTASTFDVVKASDGSVVKSGTFETTKGSTASAISIKASNNATLIAGGDTRYTVSGTGPSGSIKQGKLPTGLPLNEKLRIKVGSTLSADFIISDQVYSMVKDGVLKFFGINRSGDSENWFHKPSHLGDPITGGWYDCGDHLKEALTQGYALAMLGTLAAIYPDRDTDKYGYNHKNTVTTDGIPDVLREARHGADYFLQAYQKNSNTVTATMGLSVGDFGKDHGWWGSPEYQDPMPMDRGGTVSRQAVRSDIWASSAGRIAAGLAFTSKMYARFDPTFSATALTAAKAFYAYGRASKNAGSSPAYNGESAYYDDMALGAVALLYATGENQYLQDLAYDKTIGDKASTAFPKAGFPGGWFAHTNPSFTHELANTGWARVETIALFSFYKLILETTTKATSFGVTTDRARLMDNVAYSLSISLGQNSVGAGTVTLPASDMSAWMPSGVKYGADWFEMKTEKEWVWNRYQAGNIIDALAYYEVTKDLGVQWKSAEVLELGVRQMDYMLGINPWDISMIYGLGDKNFAHPHHRAANPEGRNVPGAAYRYRPPVGALQGGFIPGAANAYTEHFDDYYHSEICLDGSASILFPAMILAKDEDLNAAPVVSVQIEYVGYDKAIITVKQDRFGDVTLNYGTAATAMSLSKASDSAGVEHRIELTGLTAGTSYFFKVTGTNDRSGNSAVKFKVDSTQTPFDFTTLNAPPAAADIQNVKVCNVSADSAEIMWYTPNGQYDSKVYFDTLLTDYTKMKGHADFDITKLPTKFHRVKVGKLKEKTKYYFVVESNGARRAVDVDGLPLEFTTPVTQMDFNVRVARYTWGGMTALTFNIENNEPQPFDSLELRVYLRAGADLDKDVAVRFDICQAYNEAGFNLPCEDKTIGDKAKALRPTKMEDTYNADTKTWAWYLTLPLGGTVVKTGSRVRYDIMLDRRSPWPPFEDLMNQASAHVPSDLDWSFGPHSRSSNDPADFPGIPVADKNIMDDMPSEIPINPYVTVYRKNEFISGFSPSFAEMSTKKANYEIAVSYDAPFNVPNGTYVKLDAASSQFTVKGHATITEAGQVTDIWVNGSKVNLTSEVASYDLDSNHWDLNIPVKLTLGGNTVDITVFAGADASCVPCQKTGGCAFDNRNYFFDFSKGNFTASSLTISNATGGGPVVSPALPGQTSFKIQVRDTDKLKAKPSSLEALVINARKKDTTVVKLTLQGDVYVSATAIAAVAKDPSSTGANEIAFFGGDTIYVRYIDPDDPEDISEQTFFAKPTYPTPVSAVVRDSSCDGVMDVVDVTFSQAFNDGDVMDTLWLSIKDPSTAEGDSFNVVVTGSISGKMKLSVGIPARSSLPKTGAPAGSLTVYIKPEGQSSKEPATISLTDGIIPVLTGVSLLENPAPRSAQDTLKISYNEPVSLANKTNWPLVVTDGSAPVVTTGISVVGEATTTDGGKSWLYVVEGNAGGAIIDSGFTAKVNSAFAVSDFALNALVSEGGCSEPVTIVEVPKPVPVTVAEMRDRDGDGSADELYMKFERKLRTKDLLDSFVVLWGNPATKRSFLPDNKGKWTLDIDTSSHLEAQIDASGDPVLNPDSTPVMIRLKDTVTVIDLQFKDSTFAFGATQGYKQGKGGVIPRLGPEGGFFDKEYPVNDAVGPIAIAARKAVMRSGTDSLAVILSEPVDTIAGNFMIERKRGTSVVVLMPLTKMRAGSDSVYVFLYDAEAQGAVRVGDFIRLVSGGAAGVKDNSGNSPPAYAPWIEVRGTLSNKVKYIVEMTSNVTGGKKKGMSEGYAVDPPGKDDHFRITLLDPRTGREVKLGEGSGAIDPQVGEVYDTTTYKHLGPTFKIEAQLPGAMLQRLGENVWGYDFSMQLKIFDNLGQYVNSVGYKFNLDELGRENMSADGSVALRFEWMVHDKVAPKSNAGRTVASGAYIGAFQFTTVATALMNDEVERDKAGKVIKTPQFAKGQKTKSVDTKRQVFGVMRGR